MTTGAVDSLHDDGVRNPALKQSQWNRPSAWFLEAGVGRRMEQELYGPGAAVGEHIPSHKSPAGGGSVRKRCGLPLGGTLACGDARHREDRARDEVVISGGAHSQDVWFIRSGILRVQRHSLEGRRQILSLFFPGEIVGFEGEFRDGITVETATQCGLCRIDRRKFDSMVDQNDALRAELFRQKQDQLDRLHWLTWSLGALGPEERLSAFLALCSKIMPYQPLPDGTGVLSVTLPRRDIADLLGTTVESISRGAHKLADSGVIEIRDPACFRVLDLRRLIELGRIDGLFDRLTVGLSRRRRQLESLFLPAVEDAACFCGR
jgi:CRP/FNR family transcriptional regulator